MDPIAQALAEIRNPNQGAHDPIAQALTEIRGGSQISTSPSQPPAPAVPQPARAMPELSPQPAAPEDYYPLEFAGFADSNLAANVEREIREAAPVAPLPIAAPLQDIGRTVQNIMDPTFEYGVAPFLGGAISGTTRFADAAGYLADKIGADTLRDKLLEIGGAGSKFGADLTQGTAPEDIGAIGNLVRGTFGAMGSSLPSLAMGLAATPMQGTSWASGTAAALRGSSDAFGEAGDTMREVLANGGSIEEARSAANKVAAGNLVYNLVAESLVGPFSGVGENIPGLRGRLFRGAVQGAGESIQETLQDMWSAANKKRREDGQPITYLDALGNLIDEGKRLPSYLMESGAPAFLSSFLTGAGIPSVATESAQQPDAAALVSEALEELRKEDDARQALPRGERGELMRWARSETGRMAEEAQFAEDGTPENPLSEADLVRYQEIQDAMKRKDYAALSAMREAEDVRSAAPQEALPMEETGRAESTVVEPAPEATRAIAPRKGRYTDMDAFVAAATSPEGKKIGGSIWIDFDPISDETAGKIQESTGIDVHGYGHALDGSSVVHILNRHGPKGSAFKDFSHQLPITPDDFNLMPEVLENPDVIENTRGASSGNERIIFKKKVNGHALLVEEVRGRLGKLIPVSMWKEKSEAVSPTSETSPTPSGPVSAASPSGLTLPPSGEDVNARTLEDGENFEGYEQQDVGPAGTAPEQADSSKTKGAKRPRTPAEIRRLGKEIEARMIAAGRDVEEAKAMGLLASEFAGRFAKRTGIQPAEALNFEMRQGKAQGARVGGYDQSSVRQSASGQQEAREDPGTLLRRVWSNNLAYQTREDLEGAIAAINGGLTIDGFSDDGVGYFLTRDVLDRMGLERSNRAGYDENDSTTWPDGPRKEEAIKYGTLLDETPLDGDEAEKVGAILDRLYDEEARDAEKEREIYSRLEDWYLGHINIMERDAEDRLRDMRLFGVNNLAELYNRMDEAEATPASKWSPELRAFMERFVTVTKYYEPFLGQSPEDYAFYQAGSATGEAMESTTRWRGVPELEELFLDLAEVEKNLAFDNDKEVRKGLRKEKARILKEAHTVLKRMDKELDALIDEDEARQKALWAKAEEAGIKVEGDQRPEETYYQIIGKRGAEALDAAKEGTTRLDNLNVAREMEQAGKDAKAIRLATGWERGADGKWRYEIPDGTFRREGFISNPDLLEFRELEKKFIDGTLTEEEQARLEELKPLVRQVRKPSRLSDFYDSPELYAAYPELADISVKFQDRYGEGKGSYSPSENTISLDMDLRGDAAKTVLVHEIQHAIQNIEGFASGGSPSGMWLGQARKHTLKVYKELRVPLSLEEYAKNAWQTDVITDEIRKDYKKYQKTATSREADRAAQEGAGKKAYRHLGGEVEARNAEKRAHLSDAERRERLLAETEDVAREDQIILKGMMKAYSAQQPEIAENIRRGQAAMEKVISEQTDVMDAMHRDDLGSISFLWGEPGRGSKFKGGSGVSHIIAHRNAQGYDGEAVARKMVEVIAKGEAVNRRGPAGGERVDITHDGYTAVLSLYKDGERQTWLLSGWEDYKKGAPDVSSEGDGSTGTTLHGPMRARPEEGAGAPDNSKPPVAQKDKGESTAPNGRTYFLPDGTSVIEFFETANKSTSFHEFGHHVLNKMVEFSGMEGVDPQLAEDVKTILEEAGVTREAFDADTDGARTRAHEFFARGFETYLSEGKAPTARLRDAFRRIRNWMIEVYNDTAKALGIKLSDEMRGVYDRLFASDGAFGDIYGAEDVKAGTNDPAKTQGDAQPRPKTVTTKTRGGVEVERKVRDTSNDTRMMDLFNSPSVVAKRHGKFRPFFGMAKEAVEKQERMRSNWNKAVDAIYGRKGRGGLLKKDQVSLFNETLLEGDALSRVFTSEELQERGFDTNMARAYRLVRGLYDNAHRMLSAQRNKYGKEDMEYRKGYVPHFFHAWRVLDDKGIVTSFRSMNEAIRAAEKMKKEDKSRNIRVAPALDDFGGRGKLDAVTLGDMQYFKLMGNVEKAMDLSPEEARGLLEGAAQMKGRSRVFKNAWERKGVAGFDANMEYALRHYLNLSARYIAMDTLKHDGINLFERTFGRFDNDHKGLARYTKDYINDVLGVPSDVEQTLNNWVRNSWLGKYLPNIIGDRPATVAANSIASLTAHCKLGFLNIASAAMNLSQLNGTQAIIGPIWTARGLKEYLHPNQTTLRLYADAGVEENITAENPSGYSKVHQARGLLADTSMMAFRLVDGMARKVTLIGAYRKALSQGMNRSAAIEYAKQVNDDVNFDYSVADAPNFIRRTGPIGTLLFQFKKFPVKMLELALPGVGKLKGWEQVRFWAPMVALSGVFGLPGFDWLKDWLKSIFGKDLELETKKLIAESSLPEPVKRTILYGALSNLGIDVGRRAGMGDFFPSELKDLTGPAAATAARVVESLPKIFDDGNFMDTIEALSPGLANPIKAVMGEARDRRRGRVAFRYETPGERIARATGARPIREAIENDAVRIARYEQQKRSAAEADAIDDFIRAREDSDARALDRARARLRKLRITPDRIRAEMIRRRSPDGGESTAYERAMRGARTPRRIQDYRSMENYAAMWE